LEVCTGRTVIGKDLDSFPSRGDQGNLQVVPMGMLSAETQVEISYAKGFGDIESSDDVSDTAGRSTVDKKTHFRGIPNLDRYLPGYQ
jgi:hypothetical protein